MNLLENVNLGDFTTLLEEADAFQATHEVFLAAAAGTIVAGVLIGFLGLKLVRLLSAMTGLCLGAGIGAAAGLLLGLSETAVLGMAGGAALVLAVLFGIFKKVGMFIWIWLSVTSVFGTFSVLGGGFVGVVIGAVLGLVIAIISIKFFEPLVIIATSLVGGSSIAIGVLMLAGMSDSMILNIAALIVATVLCAGVQFLMHSRKIKKKEVKQAKELRAQQSRENEIEMARMLLDEDE